MKAGQVPGAIDQSIKDGRRMVERWSKGGRTRRWSKPDDRGFSATVHRIDTKGSIGYKQGLSVYLGGDWSLWRPQREVVSPTGPDRLRSGPHTQAEDSTVH